MLVQDTPTVLWELAKHGERLTCAVRLCPVGFQLEQRIGDRRLVTQTYKTREELYKQAEVVRRQCLAEGWTAQG